MKNVFAIVAMLAAFPTHAETLDAPFGFQWGQTVEQLQDRGVMLYEPQSVRPCLLTAYRCVTQNPPQSYSGAGIYYLTFYPGEGLQMVQMWLSTITGRHFTGQNYGKLKESDDYARIKKLLTEKYGRSSDHEWTLADGGNIILIEYEIDTGKISYDQKLLVGETQIGLTYRSKKGVLLDREKKREQERKVEEEKSKDSEKL